MIERLEKAFARQQWFTSDASYELRAPLAVIQAESTLALQKKRTTSDYRRSLDTVAQESGHMSLIIQQLLTRTRADSGIEQLTLEQVPLGDLLSNM